MTVTWKISSFTSDIPLKCYLPWLDHIKDHFQPPRCHLCVKHKERWKVCREINLMSGTFPLHRLIEFTGMLSRASDSFNHSKRIFSSCHEYLQIFYSLPVKGLKCLQGLHFCQLSGTHWTTSPSIALESVPMEALLLPTFFALFLWIVLL